MTSPLALTPRQRGVERPAVTRRQRRTPRRPSRAFPHRNIGTGSPPPIGSGSHSPMPSDSPSPLARDSHSPTLRDSDRSTGRHSHSPIGRDSHSPIGSSSPLHASLLSSPVPRRRRLRRHAPYRVTINRSAKFSGGNMRAAGSALVPMLACAARDPNPRRVAVGLGPDARYRLGVGGARWASNRVATRGDARAAARRSDVSPPATALVIE